MFLKFTKDVFSGMKKFFTTERVVILVVFLILMAALVMYANGKTGILDKMEDGTEEKEKKSCQHHLGITTLIDGNVNLFNTQLESFKFTDDTDTGLSRSLLSSSSKKTDVKSKTFIWNY